MRNFKIGIIRVLTSEDENILRDHENKLKAIFPQFIMETKCIENQYEGIHNDFTYKIAVPKIIKLAERWEKDLDGLIISCAGDPAVEILKDKLSIPVIGAGKSTALLSLAGGEKIGVIGIEEKPPLNYLEMLNDHLIYYEKPNGIVSTNDLQSEKGKQEIIASAKHLIELGVDTIAFACTGLTTVNAKKLLKDLNVRIIDCVQSEGIIMLAECINKYGF